MNEQPAAEPPADKSARFLHNPWLQLAVGILGMVAITNLQYGWTFFVDPLTDRFGWTKEVIQIAFTLFILAETWLVPFEGYLVDRLGPSLPVAVGGLLVGAAWVIDANATSLGALYLGGIIGGAGAGIVYGTSIGNALKWFSHNRGLAAGLTAAAFGAGSALTVVPIINTIEQFGYQAAFLWFGLGQGVVVLICALLMRAPPATLAAHGKAKVAQLSRDFTWQQMLRTPAFWLMYTMMVLVSIGGLTMTAQLASMASKDFQVATVEVTILGITMTALKFAASIDRILNGVTRPLFGWISDHIGRENTMFIAFVLQGTAVILFLSFAHIPICFVFFTGLVYFAWGEIYSLFPAMCGDLFGRRFATTNYGIMYTAKGTSSLFVPVAAWCSVAGGSWTPVLLVFSAFAFIVAFAAILVLKPLRIHMTADARREAEQRQRAGEQDALQKSPPTPLEPTEAVKGAESAIKGA